MGIVLKISVMTPLQTQQWIEDAGPWVLNMWSGIAHKACRFSDGEVGVHLACRPGAILHAGYEERWVNPTLEGFRACQHRACRQSSCTS